MLKRTRSQTKLTVTADRHPVVMMTKENLPSPPMTPKRFKSTRRSPPSTPTSIRKISKEFELAKSNDKDSTVYLKPDLSTPKGFNLYQNAKAIFRRTAVPSRLIGRGDERERMMDFWRHHILGNRPGCLYVSGSPGTGKTAMLTEVMRHMDDAMTMLESHKVKIAMINCMTVGEPKGIYTKLVQELGGPRTVLQSDVLKQAERLLQSSKSTSMLHVVVLDEIDHLITRDQEVLYKIFEWASTPSSRLVLIGIANALDLTDRVLPRLRAKNCEPQLLNFNPYQISEITAIIKDRLYSLVEESDTASVLPSPTLDTPSKAPPPLMQPAAIELCARKVAATMGDLRTALDVCRQAIELAEAEHKRKSSAQSVLGEQAKNGATLQQEQLPKVTISHVMKVLQVVFGSPTAQKLRQLNLQQKIVLGVLLIMTKQGKKDPITLGKLREQYSTLCTSSTMNISPVSRTELNDLLSMLESTGVISLGSSKEEKSRKIHLNVQEGEIMEMIRQVQVLDSWMKDTLQALPTP